MKNAFLKYLREDRLPHIFCSGCGNGIVINTFLKAMEMAKIEFKNTVLVSGIGCSSRIPGYIKCDSLHTTHGRPIAFATGIKLGNPKLNVVVFTGDGDAAAIGGNHLIHGARRNIDMTVICINNSIYGMTGGQVSPTSPRGSYGTTAPYGVIENPFDLVKLVKSSGASYVARWTTYHVLQLTKSIKRGLKNKGFSFIEVVSQCPTYYGRMNNMKSAVEMLKWMKKNSINIRKAEKMDKDELKGKIIVGEFVNRKLKEFSTEMYKLIEKKYGKINTIKSAYEGSD